MQVSIKHSSSSFRKPPQIILYNYHDHKSFLRDIIEYLRKATYRFSLRKLANAAGFSTPNIFQQIIKGNRKLNDDGIARIAFLLQLNDNEKSFFNNLVKMGQAESHEEKNKFYKQMAGSPRYSVLNKDDKKVYQYYSHWYYPVIRELVTTASFCTDPAWIARRIAPPITAAEAAKAMRTLEKLGQLRRTEGGYEQLSPVVTTGETVSSVAVTNYHKAMIAKAGESLDRFPHTRRNISSLTFAASAETYSAIVKEVFALQQRIIDMLEKDKEPAEVFQLNFQVFPCTGQQSEEEIE
ncbi:MAG: TIGR02147 family protein [Sedimentisphaerales bacterium]|nr:TIGR02147 family protein [Sedimentisphaerales bacterium]